MQRSEFRASIRRATAGGFTMVELMAVVAIAGILAVIATGVYRKYVGHTKTAEVAEMFVNIKIAEEQYKLETFKYLGPSGTNIDAFYPDNPKPGQQKMNFAGAGIGAADWQALGVEYSGPTLFVYACTAGNNSRPTPFGNDLPVGNWPTTISSPWYVVKAKADLGGGGLYTLFGSTSFSNVMYSAND